MRYRYRLQVGEIIEGYFTKNEFKLEVIEFAQRRGFDPGEEFDYLVSSTSNFPYLSYRDQEILDVITDKAIEWLNENSNRPEFTYFKIKGKTLYLLPDIERVREEVKFISAHDEDYPPVDYVGFWLHVNEHGNTTLYFRDNDGDDYEEWSTA
jgi:hypothetical protein